MQSPYPPGNIAAAIRHPHAVSANVWADESYLAIAVYDKHDTELAHQQFQFQEDAPHMALAVIGNCAALAAEKKLPIKFFTIYNGM